jgi:heme iron utilization protein
MKIQFDSIIHLLHGASFGSLATQSVQMPGYPYATLLPFVPDERHCPVFLISGLAEHTKNLVADYRASFLVHAPNGQSVLTSERVSLIGDVSHIEASKPWIARYLRYQPDARQYLALGDFAFFRFEPKGARYVAGFGEMGWVGETDWTDCAVLPAEDEKALLQDLIDLQPTGVRLLGLDSYGFDVERAGKRERQRFPKGPLKGDKIAEAMKRFLSTL